MSRFEENGIKYLLATRSTDACDKSFYKSCDLCVKHNKHLDCDACAIATAHREMRKLINVNSPLLGAC